MHRKRYTSLALVALLSIFSTPTWSVRPGDDDRPSSAKKTIPMPHIFAAKEDKASPSCLSSGFKYWFKQDLQTTQPEAKKSVSGWGKITIKKRNTVTLEALNSLSLYPTWPIENAQYHVYAIPKAILPKRTDGLLIVEDPLSLAKTIFEAKDQWTSIGQGADEQAFDSQLKEYLANNVVDDDSMIVRIVSTKPEQISKIIGPDRPSLTEALLKRKLQPFFFAFDLPEEHAKVMLGDANATLLRGFVFDGFPHTKGFILNSYAIKTYPACALDSLRSSNPIKFELTLTEK